VRIALPLARSLRAQRVAEAIGLFAYNGALASARFDKVSHILPSYQISNKCQQFAEQPVSGCNGHFSGAGAGAASAAAAGSRAERRRSGRPPSAAPGASPGGSVAGGPAAERALEAARRILRQTVGPPTSGRLPPDLLDWLLQP
jgi:hypothetical protein